NHRKISGVRTGRSGIGPLVVIIQKPVGAGLLAMQATRYACIIVPLPSRASPLPQFGVMLPLTT
ncbi:MAG: hypothetical protein ACTIBJ_20695, partial [Pseudomonas helleri]|uniref:hypothetical protein n=1 Tax=Pseudomonas helleri TaxID=1608996 RepID=UPI003F9710BC